MQAQATTTDFDSVGRTRRDRRLRSTKRVESAKALHEDLRTDRMAPIVKLLTLYRALDDDHESPSLLGTYLGRVRSEVVALEAVAGARRKKERESGETTRRALALLKRFGRISALDFDDVPESERQNLVELLALEYRWCFAAAGTTQASFKVAIGRTGAR